MKKAAIYVRGNNTVGQYLLSKRYCEEKEYDIIGATDDLKDAITSNLDVLVVFDESRLYRTEREKAAFIELFNDNGITVETAK